MCVRPLCLTDLHLLKEKNAVVIYVGISQAYCGPTYKQIRHIKSSSRHDPPST